MDFCNVAKTQVSTTLNNAFIDWKWNKTVAWILVIHLNGEYIVDNNIVYSL